MSKEGVLSVNTSGAAVIETLSSEGGPHTPPMGHNFNFSGSIAGGSAANGAIEFITPGGPGAATDGQMDAVVRTDGVTIHINASNDLEVIGGVFSEKFTVDAFTAPGTNPVVPDGGGNVNITGAQVAAGTTTNVIRTDSLAANSYTIEIQRSQAVASSTIGDNGVSHFDSASFNVDANGFVTLTGGSAIETIDGDTGSISGTTVTIFANQATLNSGSSVSFDNTGTISTLNVTDLSGNTIVGNNAGTLTAAALNANNTGFGTSVLHSLDAATGHGNFNSAFGYAALFSNIVGDYCCAFGNGCASSFDDSHLTAFGTNAFNSATSGDFNTGIGYAIFNQLLTGSYNFGAGGSNVGTNYTGAESSNILIMNAGVLGESHVMRLGTQGAGNGQINSTFIAGIVGVTVANQQPVVINSATGEMGVGSGSFAVSYTNVTFGMSPYTVLATDQYISCDTSGGAITLNFPNAPTANQTWVVKDRTGNSATNNVTITTPGGVVTFDGGTTLLLNTAYAAVNLLFNGTSYEVY